jgi:hypothetical protein
MRVLTLVFCFPALLQAELPIWSPDSVVINSAQADLLANTLTGQRWTGQIRKKVKEDENGIGITDAGSLSSQAGEEAW